MDLRVPIYMLVNVNCHLVPVQPNNIKNNEEKEQKPFIKFLANLASLSHYLNTKTSGNYFLVLDRTQSSHARLIMCVFYIILDD